MKDELEKIIQKAAIDGTLTESAAKQVQEALAENKALKEDVESLKLDVSSYRNSSNSKAEEISQLEGKLSDWEKREADLADREKKMTELELSAAHHAQRVADHQTMFGQVFRNSEIRRNVFTPVSGHDGGQYGPGMPGTVQQDQQTETVE